MHNRKVFIPQTEQLFRHRPAFVSNPRPNLPWNGQPRQRKKEESRLASTICGVAHFVAFQIICKELDLWLFTFFDESERANEPPFGRYETNERLQTQTKE